MYCNVSRKELVAGCRCWSSQEQLWRPLSNCGHGVHGYLTWCPALVFISLSLPLQLVLYLVSSSSNSGFREVASDVEEVEFEIWRVQVARLAYEGLFYSEFLPSVRTVYICFTDAIEMKQQSLSFLRTEKHPASPCVLINLHLSFPPIKPLSPSRQEWLELHLEANQCSTIPSFSSR